MIFLTNSSNEEFSRLSEFFFFNPVLHLNEFLIGMTGTYLYFLLKDRNYFKTKIISPVLLLIIVILIHLLSSYTGILNGLLDPLFMLLIIAVATENPRLLNYFPLVFIGEISYGIYILQKPVHYYIADQLNVKFLHLAETPLFYVYFVSLLFVSSLSYYIIEKPLRRKINSFYIFSKSVKPNLG